MSGGLGYGLTLPYSHHLLDGVGKGDGDGERETLGHSHHQNGDSDDNEVDELF